MSEYFNYTGWDGQRRRRNTTSESGEYLDVFLQVLLCLSNWSSNEGSYINLDHLKTRILIYIYGILPNIIVTEEVLKDIDRAIETWLGMTLEEFKICTLNGFNSSPDYDILISIGSSPVKPFPLF